MESVIRYIDDAHIVWFSNGNQYIRLEEPAFFVFRCGEKGMDMDLIVNQCVERYGIQEEESRQFVTHIANSIEAIKQRPVNKESDFRTNKELQARPFLPFSKHNYTIQGKSICFHYANRLYEYYLHPLLEHLENEANPSKYVLFELFPHHEKIVLRVNGVVLGMWREAETHLLKGMVYLQLLNVVYDKSDHDWLAIIHASAVTNGTKTIVFTAAPGNGKSTIAALLHHKGYQLVSDDFVPLERMTCKAYPFPVAMSVKDGAFGMLSLLYPLLCNDAHLQTSTTNKQVKYLPVDGRALPASVKEIIFIKYDPAVDFQMEKLPRPEAFKMLLDETWTSPSADNAERFLDWFTTINCYRISYSNNERIIHELDQLFEQ